MLAKLLLALLLASSANAATYFVSPSGLDSNNGTSTGNPWQTYTKVAATVAPGDTVLFQRNSVFYVNTTFGFGPPTGSSGSPITFDAYGTGSLPVISGGTTNTYAMGLNGNSFLVFNNLVFSGATSDGVHINNSNNLTFNGNVFINNTGCGVNFEGSSGSNETVENSVVAFNALCGILHAAQPASTILIQGNDVHDNVTTAAQFNSGIRVVSDGVGSDPQTNVSILNNRVWNNGIGSGGSTNNTGNGIHLDTMGTGLLVADNASYNNQEFGIDVEFAGTTGTHIITRNTVFGNLNTGLLLYRKSWGVQINQNTSHGNAVNIAITGQVGGDAVGMDNNVVQYNWSYQPTGGQSILINQGANNDTTNGSGNTYKNNCWGADGANLFEWGATTYSTAAAFIAVTSGAATILCYSGQQI